MNFLRTLYNLLCSLLLCDRHLPPHSKPVYGTVVLPVAPLSTNLGLESLHIENSAHLDKQV